MKHTAGVSKPELCIAISRGRVSILWCSCTYSFTQECRMIPNWHPRVLFFPENSERKLINRFQEPDFPHYLTYICLFVLATLLAQKPGYVRTSAIHLYTRMEYSNSKGRSILIHPILEGKKNKNHSSQFPIQICPQTADWQMLIPPYQKHESQPNKTAQPFL